MTDVIANGGDAPSLVAKLRELDARRAAVGRDLAACRPIPRLPEAVVADHLGQWRRYLRGSVTQARAVLQRVLDGRVTLTPDAPGGYTFTAPTRYDRLFSGLAVPRPAWIPEGTPGCEHLTAEDTLDVDYGAVLERASAAVAPPTANHVKGLASPTRRAPVVYAELPRSA